MAAERWQGLNGHNQEYCFVFIICGFLSVLEGITACLTNPRALSCHLKSSMRFSLIWDSGASVSLSYDKEDFVGELRKPSTVMQLKGIAKGIRIEGIGYAAFSITDSAGKLRTVKTKAVYCPQSSVKLLSIPALLQAYPSENVNITSTGLTFSGSKTGAVTNSIYATIDDRCNLPISQAYKHKLHEEIPETLIATISVVDRENHNLSAAGKEWLRWHFRLDHMSFQRIQFLMRTGVLTKIQAMRYLHTAIGKLQEAPKCSACLFAKSKRKTTKPPKTHTRVTDSAGALTRNNLLPGQEVSMDHIFALHSGDSIQAMESLTIQVSTREVACLLTMQLEDGSIQSIKRLSPATRLSRQGSNSSLLAKIMEQLFKATRLIKKHPSQVSNLAITFVGSTKP